MRKLSLLLLMLVVLTLTACKEELPLIASINPALDTIEVGETWVDSGCTSNGETCSVVDDDVNTTAVGKYEVTYLAIKGEEEMYLKRIVTVVDVTKPHIILNPGIDTIQVNDTWVNTGCTATDNYDSEVDCVVFSNNIDNTTIGEYEVVYRSIDDSGNVQEMTRYVFVVNDN